MKKNPNRARGIHVVPTPKVKPGDFRYWKWRLVFVGVRRPQFTCVKGGFHGPAVQLFFVYKESAVNKARGLAKDLKTELHVHNRDGKIAWRNSYGNDPRRSRG